jgi:hypothetical protein
VPSYEKYKKRGAHPYYISKMPWMIHDNPFNGLGGLRSSGYKICVPPVYVPKCTLWFKKILKLKSTINQNMKTLIETP